MSTALAVRGGPYTCLYCHALTFVPNEGRTRPIANRTWLHCGRPECKRTRQAERIRRYYRDYQQRTGERYQAQYESPRFNSCRVCGQAIKPTPNVTRCSPCAKQSHRERYRRKKAENVKVPKHTPRIWTAGPCPHCGTTFTAWSYSAPHRYCSTTCKRKAKRHLRRGRLHGAKRTRPPRRYAVHQRDAWRCQLCGTKTNPTKTVPHPRAPVIDHVIPLAAGGDDTEHNWQTAHFICNSRKRDKTLGGDQLRLPITV